MTDRLDEIAFVDELNAWCTARLAKAKRPHRYVVVDELPRTSVGKIRKFLLTEAACPSARRSDTHRPPGGFTMTTLDHPGVTARHRLDDALFDELAASVLDVSAASTLPAELYTSPDVLAFERDVLYAKEWLCVGRVERIPEPGDWFTVTICDEPIIVARDKTR